MAGRIPLNEADRLAMVERDLRDHAKSISSLAEGVKAVDARVLVLEESERTRRILEARLEEREKATVAWREGVDRRFSAISGNLSKLLWIVATAVLMAFVGWVLSGGGLIPNG